MNGMDASIQESGRQRDPLVDAIKAFAIILVIFGHCIQFGSGADFVNGELFFDNILFKIIYSFHMPLFALVSGYLLRISSKPAKWYSPVTKRLKSFVPPILFWAVISRIAGGQFDTESGVLSSLFACLYTSIHILWFLWAIILCTVVVAVTKRFFRDSVAVYILGAFLTLIVPDSFNFHLYKFVYPFFIAGYFYPRIKEYLIPVARHWLTIPVLLVCFVCLLFFMDRETYIYVSRFSIVSDGGLSWRQFYNDIFRFAIGLSGSTLVIVVLYRILPFIKSGILKPATLISRNALGIYILSSSTFPLLEQITKNIAGFNLLLVSVECIIIFCLMLSLTMLLRKNRIIARALIGG